MKIVEQSVELVDEIDGAAVLKKIERCGRVCYQSQPKEDSAEKFVRMLIKRGHESVLEHVSLTYHIVCDRAIMAEMTRHRLCAFSVESTRYCKYNELAFIKPPLNATDAWHHAYIESFLKQVEKYYQDFSRTPDGYPPEIARAVLPLCLKTEFYMTANLRELRHILRLRTSKAAHPQMREIAGKILATLREKLPVIVEDIP